MSEHTLERTCGAGDVKIRALSADGHQMIRDLIDGTIEPTKVDAWARRLSWQIEEIEVEECPVIDHEVLVSFQRTGRHTGIERWTCPVCGTEHEDEVDGDDD